MKWRVLLPWRWIEFQDIARAANRPSPWWGMAYQCLYSDHRLFMPIPLNLLARVAIRAWRWVRFDVSLNERLIYASYLRGYHQGRRAERHLLEGKDHG